MGTYATTTSLQTVMIGVEFDTATSAMVSKAVDQAEGTMNQYLGRRYDLSSPTFQTTTSIPPSVRSLTERLVEAYAWPKIARNSKEAIARGRDMEKAVLLELVEIRDYRAELMDTAGSIIPDKTENSYRVLSNTKNYVPTFGEDTSTAWSRDQQKLDDLASERD